MEFFDQERKWKKECQCYDIDMRRVFMTIYPYTCEEIYDQIGRPIIFCTYYIVYKRNGAP